MTTLDLEGAAKLLHAHPETVRLMAKSGKLPGVKVGRAWLFVEEDILRWIRGQYRAPLPEPTPRPLPYEKSPRSNSRSTEGAFERALEQLGAKRRQPMKRVPGQNYGRKPADMPALPPSASGYERAQARIAARKEKTERSAAATLEEAPQSPSAPSGKPLREKAANGKPKQPTP